MRLDGILRLVVILALIATVASAQDVKAPARNSTQTLKIDVDLVLVHATVTDPQNRYVTGLEQEYFQLWEDRIEQRIDYFSSEDVPVTVGIIFDVSGSMKDKISTARDAAVAFLKAGNPDDEYFLVEFSNRPQLTQALTTDIAKVQNRIVFTPAQGSTALYDAVYLGLETLKEANNPKKALLLITDGEDNRSRYNFSNIKEFVKEQDVQIYSIGIVNEWGSQFGPGTSGRAIVEELSEWTGGRAFFPGSVYDLEDVCTKIAIELKNQYVLGYRSTNEAQNGKWRELRVRVTPPKGIPRLNIRAKRGYYAALAGGAGKK
jgi:Ca-activated chloride channel family protein